jgi:hypothetical protein
MADTPDYQAVQKLRPMAEVDPICYLASTNLGDLLTVQWWDNSTLTRGPVGRVIGSAIQGSAQADEDCNYDR